MVYIKMQLPLGVAAIVLLCCAVVIADDEITLTDKEIVQSRFKRAISNQITSQQKLRVATVEARPYVYISKDEKVKGNDKYTGFIPDLLFELKQRITGFDYEFYEPPDKRFGSNTNGTWTGMIGELVNKKEGEGADIAASAITITHKRAQAVDFVQPFAHVGLTAVIQKPHRHGKPSQTTDEEIFDLNFDIFKPLAPEVWILVTILMIVVWLFNWLMNRFNPYEYGERYKRNLATEEQSQLFNITGSLWYTFTLLQWQGYDRAPRSMASKILGCIWMGFVTVTLVTYIGSFVNYLFWASTVHGPRNPLVVPIRDLRDLVSHHDDYTYGTIGGGATYQYLTRVSRGLEYQQMKKYWEENATGKTMIVNTVDEGLHKVRTEKYAFFMETPMAKLVVNTIPCDLMMTGIELGMRSYGMAVRKNSTFKEQIHNEIIEMIDLGVIDSLEDRWFSDQGCWGTKAVEKVYAHMSTLYLNEPQRVTIKMFWSPLVIMLLGIVLSLIVAATEIFWYKYRGRYDASNRQRGVQLTNEDDGHI